MVSFKREEKRKRKLSVLAEIDMRKTVLFAPSTPQQVKETAWEKVLETAKLVNLASANKDWTYARDELYNVWKDHTLNKLAAVRYRASAEQLGVATGRKIKMNVVDFKILDIILTTFRIEEPFETTRNYNCGPPRGDHGYDDDGDMINTSTQTINVWERVSRRRLIVVMDNYIYKKQALNLQLLRHEINIRKLTALKLENEIESKKSTHFTLKRTHDEMSKNVSSSVE